MAEHLIDFMLCGSLRVYAESAEEARRIMFEKLECADANLGSWDNGDPILCEVSLRGEPVIFEIDGQGTGQELPQFDELVNLVESIASETLPSDDIEIEETEGGFDFISPETGVYAGPFDTRAEAIGEANSTSDMDDDTLCNTAAISFQNIQEARRVLRGYSVTHKPANDDKPMSIAELSVAVLTTPELDYPDYEAIARAAGWEHGGDFDGFWYDGKVFDSWKAAASADEATTYASPMVLCKAEGLA